MHHVIHIIHTQPRLAMPYQSCPHAICMARHEDETWKGTNKNPQNGMKLHITKLYCLFLSFLYTINL